MLNGRNGISKRMALVILALVIFNYIILNTLHPGGLMAYVLPSALWGFLALVALKACGFKRIKSWFNGHVFIAAASVAVLYIIILINIGLFTGFGESTLSFTSKGLIINLTLVLTTLLGMEFSRAYLIKSFGRRRPFLTIGLVTLLYSFISISVVRLLSFSDPLGFTKFLGIGLLPIIAENLLASYLALIGGPVASLAYRGPLMAFWWFCPILPHLSWGVEALLGVMVPTVGLFVINQFTSPIALRRLGILREARGFSRAKKSSLGGWMIAGALCVLVVWASTGLLGVQPTTVISGSMNPTMEVGDMAIVREVPADSIEVGDIIQYWNGGEMAIHRVVEVSGEGNGRLFVTKGDANQEPDMVPVYSGQVRGKVVLNIPKVGWAAIAVKSFFSSVWSFISANPALTAFAIGSGAFIFYMFHMRKKWPTRKWKGSSWRRSKLGNGRLMAPLAVILILTATTGFAYSHWSDTIYVSGTVETGSWNTEIECYKVCCRCCDIDTELSPDKRTLYIYWNNVSPCKPLWVGLKIHNVGTVPVFLEEPSYEFDPDVGDQFTINSWFFGPDICSWSICWHEWDWPCPSQPPIQVDPCQNVFALIRLRSTGYSGPVQISISIVDECWAIDA
jgi:signal peptidase